MIKFKSILFFLYVIFTFLSCDKEVSVTPVQEPLSDGHILVSSNPQGALIYVNDKITGRYTPDTVIYLEEKNHLITLKQTYFNDTSFIAPVIEGRIENVFIDYTIDPSMRGDLYISSLPIGAEILLNDSLLNLTTPAQVNGLLPGLYNITFKVEDHKNETISTAVYSSQTNTAFAQLKDTTIWVDYTIHNSSLQSNYLICSVVDNNNILWIGSEDEGLLFFENNTFIQHSEFNSIIPSKNIISLSVNSNNVLFIGTKQGIVIKDGLSWQHFTTSNSDLPNNRVEEIDFDSEGDAWIATSRGLAKFDRVNWTVFDIDNSDIPSHIFTSICIDNNDNIWIGTSDSGLILYDGSSFNSFNASNSGILTSFVTDVKVESNGIVWTSHLPSPDALQIGLSFLNANDWQTGFAYSVDETIESIFVDSRDEKWIATNNGITKYQVLSNKTFFNVTNSGLVSNLVTGFSESQNGIIWITSLGGGLTKFKGDAP